MNSEHNRILWLFPLISVMILIGSGRLLAAEPQQVVLNNDADGDRIVDTIDVDDDNDGITDVNEISADGLDIDTDKDGLPNRLDLDSDNDGILDWQESGALQSVDFTALSITTVAGRIAGPYGENGYVDALETSLDNGRQRYTLVNSDFPADNLPDVIDLDSDNDGLSDLNEAGVDASLDSDGDARIDVDVNSGSAGKDGIANQLQTTNDETCCDINGDGIEDVVPRNTDQTDLPDFQDLDSDNDGATDIIEIGGADADRDGRVDNFSDIIVVDGMDDSYLTMPLAAPDLNGNGVLDQIDEFSVAGISNPDGVNTNENATDAQSGFDSTSGGRDPAVRPGANILPTSDKQPMADDPNGGIDDGYVLTGLNASGCSIQSSGVDFILLLLSVLSIAVLGWRYTLRRL